MKKLHKSEKILLVAGCSHSCGSEIEGPGIWKSQYNIDNCFGGILSKDLGLTHVNIATPGSSNALMISNLIHHLNLLLTEYSNNQVIALLGWTNFSRLEAVFDGYLYKWTFNSDLHPEWKNKPTEIRQYHKAWQRIYNHDMGCNDHVVKYTLLKNFLENKKINHFSFNAVDSIFYPKKDYLHAHDGHKIDAIGFENIKHDSNYYFPFEASKTFYNAMKEKHDFFYEGRWHHFTRDAHKEWAGILKPFIKDRI